MTCGSGTVSRSRSCVDFAGIENIDDGACGEPDDARDVANCTKEEACPGKIKKSC